MTATLLTGEGPHTAAQERSETVGRIESPAETFVATDSDHGGDSGIPPRFPPVDHDRRGRGDGRPKKPSKLVLAGAFLVLLGTLLVFLGSVLNLRSDRT